jgi:hypothetical protein
MYQNQSQLNCRCCGGFIGEPNGVCGECLDAININGGDRFPSDEDGKKRNKPRRGKAGKDW